MLFPYQSPPLVALDFVVIGLVFWTLYPVYLKQELPTWRLYFGILCIYIFCIFAFTDTDWFHYQELFVNIKSYSDYQNHLEDIYIFLIKDICPNYFLFRMIVWGSALLCFHVTFKLLGIKASYAYFILGICFPIIFAYARVSLAIALQVLGMVLTSQFKENHKMLPFFFGLALIVVSFFFHKSAIIGIASILFCFALGETNANSWFYILLGSILCIIVLTVAIPSLTEIRMTGDSEFAQNSHKYFAREQKSIIKGIGAIISLVLEKSAFFISAFLSYKILSNYKVPYGIELLAKYTLYTVLLASFFYFDYGAHTHILFNRVLRFAIIPTTLLLAYNHEHGLYPRLTKSIFYAAAMNTAYRLLYTLYISIVSPTIS